jgi:flagellar hook-associated protein 1 FlgK
MALTGALYSTLSGLQQTETRISVLSDNVSNADKPGYTRKKVDTNYTSVNERTVALSSTIVTVNYNPYLLEALIGDTAIAAKDGKVADFLINYSNQMGSVAGENSMSAYLSNFISALDQLTITPEDGSLKNLVVQEASRVTTELNRLSNSIQDYRLQIDTEIDRTVREINELTSNIEKLNKEIKRIEILGQSTANLEDDRRQTLKELAQYININYFVNDQNQVQIYTNGRPLLDTRAREITYDPVTVMDKTIVYPGGFNAIDLDGFDLTPAIKGGEIGGFIELRDRYFIEEQAKLDALANGLMDQLNAISNEGASLPPRPSLVSELDTLSAGTALNATGSFRLTTLDNDGVVQNTADIALGGLATIGDLIAAINTALGPDVTASINAQDQLQIVANNAGEGLAMNQLTSDVTPGNVSLANFFGLNNIFDGDGADTIEVSDYLISNPENLALGSLAAGAIVAGDTALFPGDSTLATTMNDSFTTNFTFAAAGNFGAQSENLNNYADKIIGDIALRAGNARANREITTSLLTQTETSLQNLSAVNIDEEMANLIDLEAKYEASATMIATIQELFDALLNAVR